MHPQGTVNTVPCGCAAPLPPFCADGPRLNAAGRPCFFSLFSFLFYPLTPPAVTPLMIDLERKMYTTSTGRIASRMNMYTLPMSNFE
jgi:hypothetical protein